ncbi:MAG TPA: thioredoxin family protein [Candidatus Sulfotelmatobacter sp.]|nr:thioredoxin family protein [Candidatus Sulfotelmatobacter sp.]
MKFAAKLVAVAAIGMAACAAWAQTADASFAPFEQWKAAVLAQDAAALKAFYSTDPAAQVRVNSVMHPADADVSFWVGLKARSMKVEFVRLIVRPEKASVIFRAQVQTGKANAPTMNVTGDQYWTKQGEQWRIAGVERTDSPRLEQPADMKKDLYPADADAHAEIKEAEAKAAKEHKRLLLVFGANWCFDCHVLDLAFHGPVLSPIVEANYEIVHVDIGPDGKKNADLVQKYEIPLDKGVPAMAVVDSADQLIVSQKNGEVEDARQLTPEFLADFLNKWKPQPR